jgi:hypothetical protein
VLNERALAFGVTGQKIHITFCICYTWSKRLRLSPTAIFLGFGDSRPRRSRIRLAAERRPRQQGWEKLFSTVPDRELFQPSKAVSMTAGRNVMSMRRTCGGLAAMLVASSAFADVASADTMTMWVRVSGANAAAHLVDLCNATHADKIELTTIPDN